MLFRRRAYYHKPRSFSIMKIIFLAAIGFLAYILLNG